MNKVLWAAQIVFQQSLNYTWSHQNEWENTHIYTNLDDRSSTRPTQHCHLSGIDAVGPIFARMVHAQDSVQHLLLLTVAWGWNHTVGTCTELQGRCYIWIGLVYGTTHRYFTIFNVSGDLIFPLKKETHKKLCFQAFRLIVYKKKTGWLIFRRNTCRIKYTIQLTISVSLWQRIMKRKNITKSYSLVSYVDVQ